MCNTSRIFFFAFLIVFSSCQDTARETDLQQRELALLEKEKQLALRESEYKLLNQFRDSVLQAKNADSLPALKTWPAALAGEWNSKVICVDSNCPDFVVGDQRTDNWDFSSDSIQLVTKVINNNKLVRMYMAEYDGNSIRMHFQTDSSTGKIVEMNVLLAEIGEKKIRGNRMITIDGKCSARFTVELDRLVKK